MKSATCKRASPLLSLMLPLTATVKHSYLQSHQVWGTDFYPPYDEKKVWPIITNVQMTEGFDSVMYEVVVKNSASWLMAEEGCSGDEDSPCSP